MPPSAPGIRNRSRRSHGFTLPDVLIGLVLVALAASAATYISLSGGELGDAQQALQTDLAEAMQLASAPNRIGDQTCTTCADGATLAIIPHVDTGKTTIEVFQERPDPTHTWGTIPVTSVTYNVAISSNLYDHQAFAIFVNPSGTVEWAQWDASNASTIAEQPTCTQASPLVLSLAPTFAGGASQGPTETLTCDTARFTP